MPLNAGEFAAGQTIAGVGSGVIGVQVDVKNRWPDGSAKFALVSGRANVSAGQALVVDLKAGSAAAGVALSEAQLLDTGIDAVISLGTEGSVSLRRLIGVANTRDSVTGRWGGGRTRTWAAGPQMSSWIYSAPLGEDAHVMAWFEVRYFGDAHVHVLAWLENGFLKVPGCTGHTGLLKLDINGSTRFAAEVHLANHCRVTAQSGAGVGHWMQTAPDLSMAHDTVYLQQTGLVPNYYAQTPANAAYLGSLVQAYSPAAFGQIAERNATSTFSGNYSPVMGMGGYHGSIGVLPEWDAFYLTTGAAPRALNAVLANALGSGRFGIHDRDETTLQPLRFSSHATLGLGDGARSVTGYGSNSRNNTTPLVTGTVLADGSLLSPATWTSTHHPSIGYLAYLVSGQVFFMEACQFTATLNYLKQNNVMRQDVEGVMRTDVGANTTRGAAWALRTLAQAACITPDDDPLQTELLASFEANIRYYHQTYVAQPNNAFGMCRPYSNYTAGSVPATYSHSTWMEDFLTAAWGHAITLRLPLSGAANSALKAFFDWKAQSIVGRLGALSAPDSYGYNLAAQYYMAVAPADGADGWLTGKGPWYDNWGQAFAASTGKSNAQNTDTRLTGAYYPETTAYWGNLMPAIAYAVELRAPGAVEAFARMTNAPNWPDFVAGTHGNPVWGVRPRNAAGV